VDVLAAQGLMDLVTVVESQEDALLAVSDGRYDCALIPRMNAVYLIEKNGWTNLIPGRHSFFSGEYSYAVSNGKAALLAEFSEGLRLLKESGEYRRIYEKWMGHYDESPPSFLSVLRYIAMVALPLLVLLLIFIFWWWSMRRQVDVRTRALRKSEEFQRAMIACSPVALYCVDNKGIVTAWNSSSERIFGWTAEEIIGSPLPIVPEGKQEEFRNLLNRVMKRSAFSNIEVACRKKNGTLFDCSLSAAPLLDDNGEVVGSMAAMEDITERKNSQLRIGHLNRVLRTIRDVNQLIVRERDRDTLIHEACRLLVNNHGYPSALIMLTDDHDLPVSWALEGIAANSAELTTILEQGKLPPCCRVAKQKQGILLVDDRQKLCSDCPIASDCVNSQSLCIKLIYDNKTYGYLAAATENHFAVDEEELGLFAEMAGDFSYALNVIEREAEHGQSEMALRESESRFRLFAELAPVGVAILDKNEQTLFVSSKFTELFGYTLEDLPSVDEWWQLAYPDEDVRNRVRREWQTEIEEAKRINKEIKPMEYPVTCKDGSLRRVVFRLATTGTLNFVVLVDISDRKRAEEERERLEYQLIQAQKMESVGRLAGGVAHDYNNMLGVIIGFAELAIGKTTPDAPLHDDLQEILNAARRATEITRQLLAFARKQTIAPQVLNLNDTLESMLKMLRRLIGEDIDLFWRPGAGLWSVNIDPSQLDQLLANLVVNARDAIADVGKITIETRNVSFDESYCADHLGFSTGEYALLAVSDDGCGMDKTILNQLFEPFFTTKDTGKGTGLGLATVYGIVKQNEGFINVYSEPGKGSTIKIYLPRHGNGADLVKEASAAEIPQGHGETILIVEDEAAILRLAGKMLERQKYIVLEAATPGRAMEIAKEHGDAIDLLITDVIMPEMNGRDLANELQVLYPELKVLFMSGYTANVIAHRGVLDEGVNFVQKPFSNHGLAVKVREVLTR
jgi:PAS domain S-box-containing protein